MKPAAVELHTTMDLLCDAPTTVVLTPDTTNEQTFLPEPASLRDSVLLADRGYVDLHYLRRVQEAGGFFLIRAKAGMNPQVLEAFREDGKRLRSLRNKPLQTIHAKLPKRQRVELVVQWHVDGASPVSASHLQLESTHQEFLLFPDEPAISTVPLGGDLSGLQMEMASGVAV